MLPFKCSENLEVYYFPLTTYSLVTESPNEYFIDYVHKTFEHLTQYVREYVHKTFEHLNQSALQFAPHSVLPLGRQIS